MLRFRVLGASFSKFGCFVLRSSFLSASFSKLLFFHLTAFGDKYSGITCLALMWFVPTLPKRSAIMNVVYGVT